MDIFIGILEQGLIYSLLALGIYITYTILNFPDLTVDSSFPLGAAVSVRLIAAGVNPWLSLLPALLAGCLAGFITGIIHVKFKVKDLFSGIIVMTGLYSVNLFIAGKANLPIFQASTIFLPGQTFLARAPWSRYATILVSAVIVLLVKIGLDLYFQTKSGLLLRAVGDNHNLPTSLAVDANSMKVLGLALANGLVALSGAVLGQQQRFFEISMGTGSMVMGLASVILGIKLLDFIPKLRPSSKVILGSIAYKAVIAAAIALGLSPNSLKLVTALLLLVILVLSGRSKGQDPLRSI
ncbi:MAG: ABC transporter permease [Eubacteriales bacterium]|nr:ABC transporter permease [Clostridiales bacterium]MDY5836353.1 ABC transporter permease [Eubacteriales bacterium]